MMPPRECIEQVARDGYTIIPGLMPQDQVERARAAMGRVYRGEYNDDRRRCSARRRCRSSRTSSWPSRRAACRSMCTRITRTGHFRAARR